MRTLCVVVVISTFFSAARFIRAQAPSPDRAVVAVVAGQPVSEKDLDSQVQAQLRRLRNQEYELRRKALDDLIAQRLVEAEARRQGVTLEQLLKQQVDSKLPNPSEAEIQAFYLGQRDRIEKPLEEVRPQIVQALKHALIVQARQAFAARLRQPAEVVVLLRPPKTEVALDPRRIRGNPNAPVQIVEFSDFQCPYCRRAEEALKEVLASYGDRVALSYRDLPLRQIHPHAQGAAEAALCAADQGKFWEYHDKLLEDQSKLDSQGLAAAARAVGLDTAQFDSCLSSGKHRPDIDRDVQDASRLGIAGTPAFFINGVFLDGAQPVSAFREIIDGEVAAAAYQSARSR